MSSNSPHSSGPRFSSLPPPHLESNSHYYVTGKSQRSQNNNNNHNKLVRQQDPFYDQQHQRLQREKELKFARIEKQYQAKFQTLSQHREHSSSNRFGTMRRGDPRANSRVQQRDSQKREDHHSQKRVNRAPPNSKTIVLINQNDLYQKVRVETQRHCCQMLSETLGVAVSTMEEARVQILRLKKQCQILREDCSRLSKEKQTWILKASQKASLGWTNKRLERQLQIMREEVSKLHTVEDVQNFIHKKDRQIAILNSEIESLKQQNMELRNESIQQSKRHLSEWQDTSEKVRRLENELIRCREAFRPPEDRGAMIERELSQLVGHLRPSSESKLRNMLSENFLKPFDNQLNLNPQPQTSWMRSYDTQNISLYQ